MNRSEVAGNGAFSGGMLLAKVKDFDLVHIDVCGLYEIFNGPNRGQPIWCYFRQLLVIRQGAQRILVHSRRRGPGGRVAQAAHGVSYQLLVI